MSSNGDASDNGLLGELEQRMVVVADGIAATAAAATRNAVAPLAAAIADLRAEVEAAASAPAEHIDLRGAVEPLAERLDRLERLVGTLTSPDPAPRIELLVELDRVLAGRDDEQARRLAELTDRVAVTAASSSRAAVEDASATQAARLDAIVEQLFQRIDSRSTPDVDHLAGRITGPLRDQLTSITTSIGVLRDERRDAAQTFEAATGEVLASTKAALDGAVRRLDEWRPLLEQSLGSMVNQVHQVREGEAVQRQRIEQLHAAVRRLSDEQPDLITSLVPVHDRLEGLHQVSAQLAALDASLRQLPAVIDDANARAAAAQLDAIPNAVALATEPLGIARAHDVATLAARVDQLASAAPPPGTTVAAVTPADQAALLEPVVDELRALSVRIDELAAGGSELSAAIERTRRDVTGGLADTTGSHAARLHELGTDVNEQLGRLADQLATVASAVQAAAEQSKQETLRALDERFADVAATHGELATRVDEVRDAVHAVAASQPDVHGAVAPLAEQLDAAMSELGATVTGGHSRLDEIAAALADVRAQPGADVPVSIEPLTAQLDELHSLMGATGEQLHAMASSIAELRVSRPDITTSLHGLAELLEGVRAASESHRQRLEDIADSRDRVRAQLAGITGLAEELRGELQRSRQDAVTVQDAMSASTDRVLARVDVGANRVLDTVASREQQVGDGMRRLDAALADLRHDVDALGREVRSHRGTDEVSSGAGAALVASAAAAMARLEGRLDQEFDSIGAQIDALGALVHEAIDSLHGTAPTLSAGTEAVTDRVRAAASSMFEALRATSRQRAARRYRAGRPPQGIGRGGEPG